MMMRINDDEEEDHVKDDDHGIVMRRGNIK